MELLFEEITKKEKEDITLEIIKEMKKDIEKLVEVEVLKQLNGNKNSKSTKAVKEIVSKSMVNLFRTLFNRSSMWSNTLEENNKVGLNENDNKDAIKPKIFQQTIYRMPTTDELIELNTHINNLTPQDIYNGFGYTMIGRGIKNDKNKKQIVDSIKELIKMFPDENKYKEALKLEKV